MKSKTGLSLVGIYLFATLAVVIYSTTCSDLYCGFVLAGPVMPWPFILEGVFDESYLIYATLIALNSSILYLLGMTLERLISMIKNRGSK
jgi:hypothetical protein